MFVIIAIVVIFFVVSSIVENKYKQLEAEVFKKLGFSWGLISYFDDHITVKSRQALEKYDSIKYFKDTRERLSQAETTLNNKSNVAATLRKFLRNNEYKSHFLYNRLKKQIDTTLHNAQSYRISVTYISPAGKLLGTKEITITQQEIDRLNNDPALLMSKGEYSKFLKEQQKESLSIKHREYYEKVNKIIDYSNKIRDTLVVKGSKEQLDLLIAQLFDRTVNSIKKIKTTDSEEWHIIEDYIIHIAQEVKKIANKNKKVLEYYDSPSFHKIKETCEVLMRNQREFNEYIDEKAKSISLLFGTKVVRNETINDDEHSYIRPYKKSITPFTAEVSAAVFASAENNPMEYLVKNFYPNKKLYPEQIQKLNLLLEELETLREAKHIIDNYKIEYQQYLVSVPAFVMENDEDGFYSRLGFATIDDSVLTVEYKFSYTSGGGMAQRSFTIPMTEDTIIALIKLLESKLTATAFAKEQRTLMTKKLRTFIKSRDNFTCCSCGNSTYLEPNLLLEVDHIIPISKGGYTEEKNLQTLCWKCNRAKGARITS